MLKFKRFHSYLLMEKMKSSYLRLLTFQNLLNSVKNGKFIDGHTFRWNSNLSTNNLLYVSLQMPYPEVFRCFQNCPNCFIREINLKRILWEETTPHNSQCIGELGSSKNRGTIISMTCLWKRPLKKIWIRILIRNLDCYQRKRSTKIYLIVSKVGRLV